MNSQEQKRLLMDLDINMRTVDCFYTVTFYGALFREVSSSLAASPSRRRGWTWGQEGSGRQGRVLPAHRRPHSPAFPLPS